MIVRTLRAALFCIYLAATLSNSIAATSQHTWSGVEKIVAVGDIHGDYDQLVKALHLGGLIDQKNNWTGGKTHLVQTGDILDRGPDSKKAMELMMTLEKEASAAGGMVHVLIGNHEALRLGGQSRDKDLSEAEIETYGGMEEMKKAFGPDGKYGAWIRSHNSAIKINDTLFLHAGLSAKYAAMSLDELNKGVREGLKSDKPHGLARDNSGPLWYRGLADEEKLAEDAVVQQMDVISKAHGIKRIVIGHTVKHNISTRANGRVIMIDVGMTKVYGGKAACLIIEGGKAFAVNDKGKTELPSVGSKTSGAAPE